LLCHDRSLAYECEIGHCAFPECKYETGHEARERALRGMNWLATSCDGLRALVGTRKIMMSSTHPSALRAGVEIRFESPMSHTTEECSNE
jgi:hypothetical protein